LYGEVHNDGKELCSCIHFVLKTTTQKKTKGEVCFRKTKQGDGKEWSSLTHLHPQQKKGTKALPLLCCEEHDNDKDFCSHAHILWRQPHKKKEKKGELELPPLLQDNHAR